MGQNLKIVKTKLHESAAHRTNFEVSGLCRMSEDQFSYFQKSVEACTAASAYPQTMHKWLFVILRCGGCVSSFRTWHPRWRLRTRGGGRETFDKHWPRTNALATSLPKYYFAQVSLESTFRGSFGGSKARWVNSQSNCMRKLFTKTVMTRRNTTDYDRRRQRTDETNWITKNEGYGASAANNKIYLRIHKFSKINWKLVWYSGGFSNGWWKLSPQNPWLKKVP